jgi:glucose-6-phosphate-specific signal transduction histidine kinase
MRLNCITPPIGGGNCRGSDRAHPGRLIQFARACATTSAEAGDANLRLSIRVDGIGGADSANGSGLIGLIDRVEALGGKIAVSSQPGNGTSLLVEIPVEVG